MGKKKPVRGQKTKPKPYKMKVRKGPRRLNPIGDIDMTELASTVIAQHYGELIFKPIIKKLLEKKEEEEEEGAD